MGSTLKQQHPARQALPHLGHSTEVGQNPGPSRAARTRALRQALTLDIIPRLVRAHSTTSMQAATRVGELPALDSQGVLDFAHLVLHAEDAELQERVQGLRRRGVTHERILLDLLMPVARHMGQLWEYDLCDFHDVTLAVGRLQQLLRSTLAGGSRPALVRPGSAPQRILLTTPPGEQHTFGLSMVGEFFHQAGWDVANGFLAGDASPVQLVREQRFDMVGLSLGSGAGLPAAVRLVDDLRRASLNREIFIIAGGPIFSLHPEYELQLLVDAVITDASKAPAQAEQLLMERKAMAV